MRLSIIIRIGSLVTLGAVACSSPPPWPLHRDVEHTTVPCIVHAGMSLNDYVMPLTEDSVGPQACGRALELYLRDHPDAYVGLVTPFVAPPSRQPSPTNEVRGGTQSLLVEYMTTPVPWPRARRLAVRDVACIGNTSCTDQTSRVDCASAIRGNPQRNVWQWIPLISDTAADATRCTRDILYLYERDE